MPKKKEFRVSVRKDKEGMYCLVLWDSPANLGNVLWCDSHGHAKGDWEEYFLKKTVPVKDKDIINKVISDYGYTDIEGIKVVNSRPRDYYRKQYENRF